MNVQETNIKWSSPNEVFATNEELDILQSWRAIDDALGKTAEKQFGFSSSTRISFRARVIRRIKFEFQKISISVLKTMGYVWRLVFRKYGHRVWSDLDEFETNGVHFKVFCLDKSIEEIIGLVNNSNADYFVLTRTTNSFLKTNTETISDEIRAFSPDVIYGDVLLANRTVYKNFPFSRLLFRQVDFFGPVIIVSRNSIQVCINQPDLSPTLWPVFLGLNIEPAQISYLEQPFGVGESIQNFPEILASELVNLVNSEISLSKLNAEVVFTSVGRLEIKYSPRTSPLVSIIIPTRGSGHGDFTFVANAVDSILKKSTYRDFELCIIADANTPQFVITQIDEMCSQFEVPIRWIRWSEPFHFSKTMNIGSVVSAGELLLFLNDDIEVVAKDWIDRMVSLLQIDNVKHIGALLFFEDQTIQHAGHFYKGGAGHIGFGENLRLNSPQEVYSLDRTVSGVTAACSLIPRETFDQIGGFTEIFPGNYNDVDLSLKIELSGYSSAISSHSRLYHFESKTRDATVSVEEILKLNNRWGKRLTHDPWWNN